jgi:ethanolamine utilization microcompartment shell protein EutS
MNAMTSTVAEIKAELTQIEEYIKKWIPGHQVAVNHFVTNPPSAIDEVHQKVKDLFAKIENEASKSAVFAPPVVEAETPIGEAPHV